MHHTFTQAMATLFHDKAHFIIKLLPLYRQMDFYIPFYLETLRRTYNLQWRVNYVSMELKYKPTLDPSVGTLNGVINPPLRHTLTTIGEIIVTHHLPSSGPSVSQHKESTVICKLGGAHHDTELILLFALLTSSLNI